MIQPLTYHSLNPTLNVKTEKQCLNQEEGGGDVFIEEHLTIIPSFSLLVKRTEKWKKIVLRGKKFLVKSPGIQVSKEGNEALEYH